MKSKNTETTEMLLRCIARHLSSRPECRQAVYRLSIGLTSDLRVIEDKSLLSTYPYLPGRVTFTPHVMVYPDTFHRREENKEPVIEHVIMHHFKDKLYRGRDEQGNLFICSGCIVPGVYEYQPSLDNKRRRWVRIR